jgi:hypothetical protein
VRTYKKVRSERFPQETYRCGVHALQGFTLRVVHSIAELPLVCVGTIDLDQVCRTCHKHVKKCTWLPRREHCVHRLHDGDGLVE